MLTRGASAPASVPGRPVTQVVVTIALSNLIAGVRGAGQVLGQRFGSTNLTLDPGTVRRMACDADVIPIVLGTASELLDLGRTHRLVTPGMRKALWVRDQGCTYPECTIPAAWTEAHHITHWSNGGPTSMDNLTLLCGRHHTTVHNSGAHALIEHGHVHWTIPTRHRRHVA